jgi:hypothetical protein
MTYLNKAFLAKHKRSNFYNFANSLANRASSAIRGFFYQTGFFSQALLFLLSFFNFASCFASLFSKAFLFQTFLFNTSFLC